MEHLATALRAHGADGLTLEGYKYDDGRYWTAGDNFLRLAGRKTLEPSHDNVERDGGYIVDTYKSEAKTKEALFKEAMLQLKKELIHRLLHGYHTTSKVPLLVQCLYRG